MARPSPMACRRSPLAASLLLALMALSGGCGAPFRSGAGDGGGEGGGSTGPTPLTVAVSTAALGHCAGAIGGDRVEVIPLVEGKGAVPSRGALQAAQNADLILLEGGGLEPWLSAVSLPEEAMVVASPKEPSPSTPGPGTTGPGTAPADEGAHRHGPGGATHRQGQPVLGWLDLQRLGRQCERVHRELADRRPLEAEALAASHRLLQKRLQALDSAFLAAARPLRDIAMVAAGGEVQPLARRYGLSMRFSRHRPGSDPSGGHQLFLQELDDLARQAPLDVVVLPAPPAPDLKAELARRRLRVLVVDPLVDPDGGSAFPQGLQRNLEALRALSERS